ncbi:MAG: hypothetical protein HOE48_11405 [Candidatus Latescibacteria bacterium]|nr:hypothetical protein [Candidatus Latescibacterota bacterium]
MKGLNTIETKLVVGAWPNFLVGISLDQISEVANQIFDGRYDKTECIPEEWTSGGSRWWRCF